MLDYTNFNVRYLQNNDYEAVVFNNNNDLSWDTSYSYFVKNKWIIKSFAGNNNSWFRKLAKNGQPLYLKAREKKSQKDAYNQRNKFDSIIDHNIVDWTPLRLKRLMHLIGCETDKETIMESFATSSYEQIKIGMNKIGITRKKVAVKTYRKSIKHEPSINQQH
jgi:hypothetical protein